MPVKTAIYNETCRWIGVERISSITEDSPQRRALDDQYTPALESTLQDFGWKFAKRRVKLAQNATAPAFGYDYSYALPGDHLTTLEVWNGVEQDQSEIIWEEENGNILTDQESFYIIYTTSDVKEADFTPLFTSALALNLAARVAIPLKQNRSLMVDMQALYDEKIIEAQTRDAKKRSKKSTSKKSSWMSARSKNLSTFVNVIRVT